MADLSQPDGPPLPPHAPLRGGSPSSVRSKLGKKLKRATLPPPEPLQLLQALWPLEAQTLSQMQAEPDALAAQVCSASKEALMRLPCRQLAVSRRIHSAANAFVHPGARRSA